MAYIRCGFREHETKKRKYLQHKTVVPKAETVKITFCVRGVATVPLGNRTTSFTLPGMVNVTVVTSGGTSNAVTLRLTEMLTFNVNNLTWAQTTPLPLKLTGLRAVVVPQRTRTNGFVVVTAGYDGSSNQTKVFSNTLNSDGTVGASWVSITFEPQLISVWASLLPSSLADLAVKLRKYIRCPRQIS